MGIISQAIEGARVNTRRNGITNAVFYTGKAEEVLPAFYEGKLASEFCQDAGAFLSALLTMAPEKIVYISCNPVTQARDLKTLTANGYQVKVIQPVDLVPGTKHVETVCLLSKLNVEHRIEVEL